MKVALVQLNPVIGDIEYNEKLIIDALKKLDEGVDLAVLSELVITGYPPRDLLNRKKLINDNIDSKNRIVEFTKNVKFAVAFGYVEKNTKDGGKSLFNAICIAQNGKIIQERYKTLLPTYDVFCEDRYFEPGNKEDILPVLINVKGTEIPVGFLICEESWNDLEFWKTHEYTFDPVDIMAKKGAKVIININGSPFRIQDKDKTIFNIREEMVREHVLKHNIPFVYVNQVGANDEIIFDGNSFAMNDKGEIIGHCLGSIEDIYVVDIFNSVGVNKNTYSIPFEEEILNNLILGVRDYFSKQPNFKNAPACLGLSGGIDSALVAFIAKQALGADRVIAIGMPSEYSSDGSKTDAEKLANTLGIRFLMVPIQNIHNSVRNTCSFMVEQSLEKYPELTRKNRENATPDYNSWGVTDENIQPRARMSVLMHFSNYFNALLLTTGNKSELAVGYCTIYGDMAGGLAVINDVLKTLVFRLCRYINKAYNCEIIPWNTINKPPSAELRPDQKDQDSLPPYEVLDEIITKFVDDGKDIAKIEEEMVTVESEIEYIKLTNRDLKKDIRYWCNVILRNEYKRKQTPKGLKIDKVDFGCGWQMPIVHRAKL